MSPFDRKPNLVLTLFRSWSVVEVDDESKWLCELNEYGDDGLTMQSLSSINESKIPAHSANSNSLDRLKFSQFFVSDFLFLIFSATVLLNLICGYG